MKNIIAATAVSLMMSTSAIASNHMQPMQEYTMQTGDIQASEFIGMRVYATEAQFEDGTRLKDGAETEWDDIGEVNDVILGRDGSVRAVILGVGGFLGIGEKDVAVQMNQIRMVQEEGDSDDFFLVVNTNKNMLEDAPAYVDDRDERMANADRNRRDAMAETDPDGRMMLPRPGVQRQGYREAAHEELTAEKLTGARVYGINDEDIGEVNTLVLSADGKQIERVVIDVGGFLGIGEHQIAVTLNEVQILRDEGYSDVRVFIDATQEDLEKQPEYAGS